MKPLFFIVAYSSIGVGLFLAAMQPPRHANLDKPKTGATSTVATFRPRTVGHPAFMSPHASPTAVVGESIFVVNTPSGTVDIVGMKSKKVEHRIQVGVEPVSIAVRPDGKEVWVSNHVSDSVSVIDTDSSSPNFRHVVATIQEFDARTKATRFDEPVGIAFANNEKAYVALSSENQIAVIDVASRRIRKRLKIRSQDPRQILVRNNKLYVIPFESNNKTQLSGGRKEAIDGDLVTFDAWDHSIANNNVLSIGHVVDIIKHPDVPDRDLYIFDTKTDKLLRTVDSLGTLLYGMTVDSEGTVYLAQTDARNHINGRAGTKKHGLKELDNRAFLNQVTRVSFGSASSNDEAKTLDTDIQFFDLEPAPPKRPRLENVVATPFAIEIDADEKTLLVTAAGSDKLVAVDKNSGEIKGSIKVGSVPRGIALSRSADDSQQAWVFNAVDNSLSLVEFKDAADMKLAATIQLDDPTDPDLKQGRKIFNSASASSTGTFSCASCHPDGHTDQLLWVLKTPVVTGGNQIMPRSTMPVRGLRETAPFHWDGIPGDPYGGNNSANVHRRVKPNSQNSPVETVRHLIDGALATTMAEVGNAGENDEGKSGLLNSDQRDDLAKFLLSIPYPPAQRRSYTNVLSPEAKKGFELFHVSGDDDPSKVNHNVCGDCHRMPNWVSTNTPGTGMDAPTWRGAYDRWLILPQGRLNLVEFPFFKRVAEEGLDERRIWQFSWGGRSRFNPVWNMVLEGSTGQSGAFARQVTLSRSSADQPETKKLLLALETAALESAVVLQASGNRLHDDNKAEPLLLQFDTDFESGVYRSIPNNLQINATNSNQHAWKEQSYTSAELFRLASEGKFIGTFTANMDEDQLALQPVLWTSGPIERQSGHQRFPFLYPNNKKMSISGRNVAANANVVVNGRRVDARLSIGKERIEIELKDLPHVGLHLLQVQNPGGQFSNDFIFHVVKDQSTAEATRRQIELNRTGAQDRLKKAIAAGNVKAVQRLLDRRIQINARHIVDGNTALSTAALYGEYEIAKRLIKKGARVSRTNRDGNTPLHIAAFLCRFEIVDLLIENGASASTKNQRQETPVDVVSGAWNEGLADFYQVIADSSGFEIDLDRIRNDRSRMAKRLQKK